MLHKRWFVVGEVLTGLYKRREYVEPPEPLEEFGAEVNWLTPPLKLMIPTPLFKRISLPETIYELDKERINIIAEFLEKVECRKPEDEKRCREAAKLLREVAEQSK